MSLTNTQYSEIMRTLDDRRKNNFRRHEEEMARLYQDIPELKALDDEIAERSVSAAEHIMAGDRSEYLGLKNIIEEIRKKKTDILDEHGLPADAMDMHYDCPDCKDTGFVDGQKCHCFRAMQQSMLFRQSHIEQIVRKQNFRTFDPRVFDDQAIVDSSSGKTNRQYMLDVKAMLERYCQAFDAEGGNILLMGNPGTGKTYLINCVAGALMESCHSVIYLSSTDLFESLSKASFDRDKEKTEFSEAILDCDLLVIDDLGTELNNSFTTSKLFYIINQRMVYGKSVIISTNLSLSRIRDNYSERVVSRFMSDYAIIPVYGKDLRVGI